MSTTNVTVLGASGGSGQAITAELAGRGHAVTAVDRRGDAPAPPYDAWAGDFDRMLDSVLAAVAAAGARLVHVDNLYMYGPADGPISERSPEHATGKGALRRRVAQRILTDDRLRATAGRYSDYSVRARRTASCIRCSSSQRWRAGACRSWSTPTSRTPSTTCPTPPVGSRLSSSIPRRTGRRGSCPRPRPSPRASSPTLSTAWSRSRSGSAASAEAGSLWPAWSPARRVRGKITHQFDRPWVIDASAFEAAFGPLPVTDHETALSETLTWVRGPDGRQSRQRKGKR